MYLIFLQVGAIIISPTRELAKQIDEVLQKFTEDHSQLRSVSLGMNMGKNDSRQQ